MNSTPPPPPFLGSGFIPISAPFCYNYLLPASMKIGLAKNAQLERVKAVQQAMSNSLDKYPSNKIIDSDIKDAPCCGISDLFQIIALP